MNRFIHSRNISILFRNVFDSSDRIYFQMSKYHLLDCNSECVFIEIRVSFVFGEYQFVIFFSALSIGLMQTKIDNFCDSKLRWYGLEGKGGNLFTSYDNSKERRVIFFLIKIELVTMHDKLLQLNESSLFINRKYVLGRCSQAKFCFMENSSKKGSKVYQTAAVSRMCLLFFLSNKTSLARSKRRWLRTMLEEKRICYQIYRDCLHIHVCRLWWTLFSMELCIFHEE